MAKYTELFAEYLAKGGQLPASFGLITGFEDIFKKYYFDKEIGFETELIFYMKLDMYATLYMQKYADKISRLASAWLEFDAPAKVIYETDTTAFAGGKRKTNTTELPFDSATAEASLINESDAYSDNNTRTLNRSESGATFDEALRRVTFLNESVKNLIIDLLYEFKPCFMVVY